MVLGGWKGDLAVVLGCGMNRLDGAKLVPNVMRVQSNTRCFFEQD